MEYKYWWRNVIYKDYINKNRMKIKTVDHFFAGDSPSPYVPDLLNKTALLMNTTPAMQALMIQQGTSECQRLGNSVRLKSIRLRFQINIMDFINVSYTGLHRIRVLLVYDRQPNGAYPNISQIINNLREDGTQTGFTFFGDLNVDNMNRFIILMDHFEMFPEIRHASSTLPEIPGPYYAEQEKIDKYIKLDGLKQTYATTSSPMTISSMTTGALYLIAFSDITDRVIGLVGKARIRFIDI